MIMERGGTPIDADERRGASAPLSAQAMLVLAMECDRPLAMPVRFLLGGLDAVTLGRGERREWKSGPGAGRWLDVRIPDEVISAIHARLLPRAGRWTLEDADSRNGTRVNGERVQHAVLSDGDLVEVGHTLLLFREPVPTLPTDPRILDAGDLRPPTEGLATLNPSLAREFQRLESVARSPQTLSVVLHGPSGTGKEVMARAVHALSGRQGSFIAVNCGALPETIIETELFGYRKGAFSGAQNDRPGLIRSADGGTLFLDEIADLPLALQPAFLRVLQEREVMPVGATAPVKVDIRLVAATHGDLDQLVQRGGFRSDLAARVAGYTLELPPLAERREDLGLLIAELLRRSIGEKANQVRFSPDAGRAILSYPWPSNIRELEKCLQLAAVLATDGGRDPVVALEHLPAALRRPLRQNAATAKVPATSERPLTDDDATERAALEALLREHAGNLQRVADARNTSRAQIHRLLKRLGLSADDYRES
jgi:DNA-binding NtrC family response regulator